MYFTLSLRRFAAPLRPQPAASLSMPQHASACLSMPQHRTHMSLALERAACSPAPARARPLGLCHNCQARARPSTRTPDKYKMAAIIVTANVPKRAWNTQ
jgi:hypothetical protein